MDILMEIRLFQILGYNVCMYRYLEQIKGYFTVTFFLFLQATFSSNSSGIQLQGAQTCWTLPKIGWKRAKVWSINVRNSIAKCSNLLDITKNWLKKGQSLKKSSAFDSETNNHRPLTRTLVSKWKSCATNHLPQCEQCLKMSEE